MTALATRRTAVENAGVDPVAAFVTALAEFGQSCATVEASLREHGYGEVHDHAVDVRFRKRQNVIDAYSASLDAANNAGAMRALS